MSKTTYQVKKFFKMLFTGIKTVDDYDWRFYNDLYEAAIKDVSKNHTLVLKPGDYAFQDGRLLKKNQILPLHPNYSILYETLLQLAPDSIMEIGCGGGDHLHNINILSPNIFLYGIDVSEGQLTYLRHRHPDLSAEIFRYDITADPDRLNLPVVDIAFTGAVIMHIRENHLNGLANLFHIARDQVLLMENWKRHEFMDDIQRLYDSKKIPWNNIYFYYKYCETLKKPHLMIVSSSPLKQYPILTNYNLLTEGVTEI